MNKTELEIPRREFLENFSRKVVSWYFMLATLEAKELLSSQEDNKYDPAQHNYAMGIDIHKCIGCGRCAEACKKENKVSSEPVYFRTWVERYVIPIQGEAQVDSPNGGMRAFPN